VKRYDRIAAAFLVVAGAAAAFHSWWNLKLGTFRQPDSGFMPFGASLLLMAMSLLWLAGSRGSDERPEPFWERGAWRKPLLALGFLIGYAVLMEPLGYVPSTLLFALAWQLLVERERWMKGTVIAAASTAAMYVMFVYLLGVPVPAGVLGI
jgi:hypothetical protein